MKQINLEQGSTEWLEFRDNGIGGSDIASIAGVLGAFNKRHDVMGDKLGQKKKLTAFKAAMFSEGHAWEQVVRDAINASGSNFIPAVVVSDESDRYFASLDGLDTDREMILEVKSVFSPDKFEQYKGETPAHYMAQVQWQLYVTKYQRAILAFVHEGEVVQREILADPIYQGILTSAAQEFITELDAIKAGTQPNPFKAVKTTEIIRIEQLKRIEADMKIQMAMITEELKVLAEKVLDDNKATRLETDGVVIAWQDREGSTDYKKACEDHKIDVTGYKKKGTRFITIKTKGTDEA